MRIIKLVLSVLIYVHVQYARHMAPCRGRLLAYKKRSTVGSAEKCGRTPPIVAQE